MVLFITSCVESNCMDCHASDFANQRAGGIIIENYNSVKIYIENGLLLPAINWEPGAKNMPLGGSQLSDCQLETIERWVNEGMVNN